MEKIGKRRGGKWMGPLLMLLLVWLFGCDRKWPMNGALDGQWQLLTVETRADGVVTDRKDEQLFFRFQLQLLMLTDLGGNGYGTYVGRMTYDQEAQIVQTQEMNVRTNTGDSGIAATAKQLAPFGLDNGTTRFEVVKADGDHLILESDYARLTLRKF